MSNLEPKPLDLKIKCQTEDEMKERFIKCILGSINVILTDKEFDILFTLCKHCNGILNADTRKEVCKRLSISIGNLNNYLSRMNEKKLFTTIGDKVGVYPVLMVDIQKLGFLKLTFVHDKQ